MNGPMDTQISIRPAQPRDHDAIWRILEPVIRAGETWALPREMSREQALAYWFLDRDAFVAEIDGEVVGTYFFRTNQAGPGSHVGNCGYMTASSAQGRGVARAMALHSIEHARTHGFRAIQFNFVVSTNTRAVALWQSAGFEIVGRLPGAFAHPQLGYVDVYVMYQHIAAAHRT
jgi:ribosomal protein S18 acetylase RimI-like enzyme